MSTGSNLLVNFWAAHRIKTMSLLTLVFLSYLFWAWQHRHIVIAATITAPAVITTPATTAPAVYTLQLMSGMNVQAMQHYIQTHHLTDKARILKTQYQGHDWYVLSYGQYTQRRHAKAALSALPDTIKSHHPWVRSTKQLRPIDGKLGPVDISFSQAKMGEIETKSPNT